MNSHATDWKNLKTQVLMELARKFQDREQQRFRSTTPMVGKSSRRTIHSSSNNKIFFPHASRRTIKSELRKAISSFSLQVAVGGVSVEEIVCSVKETSNKKAIWIKEKRCSKEDKVGIRESSSETDMEIEFENDDSGGIRGRGADSLY
jgi:hypothetical protein